MPFPIDGVLEQLRWRYATKKFDPSRRIPTDLWTKLESAMMLSPSSYGLQPWRFVVVTDAEVRRTLRQAAWNQPQITDASHLVVFCVKKNMTAAEADRWVRRIAEVRGQPVETLEGMRQTMAGSLARKEVEEVNAWMSRQVYIALGMFLCTAAVIGIDACPMEGFENDKYDTILGLESQGYGSVVLGAAGYRSVDDAYAAAAKVRYDRSDVFTHI